MAMSIGSRLLGNMMRGRELSEEQEMIFGMLAPMIGGAVIRGLSGREQQSEEQDQFFISGPLIAGALGSAVAKGLFREQDLSVDMKAFENDEDMFIFSGPILAAAAAGALRGALSREQMQQMAEQDEFIFTGPLLAAAAAGALRGALSREQGLVGVMPKMSEEQEMFFGPIGGHILRTALGGELNDEQEMFVGMFAPMIA